MNLRGFMGIQEKFENLLTHDRLSDRDRQFCQSLYDYYLRKKRLTAGRRRCLANLEAHYGSLPSEGLLEPELATRIRALLPKTQESSWDRGFSESILSQVESCRKLSDRQIEILAKIEERHSEAALETNRRWREAYTTDLSANAEVCARYYTASPPYFKELCDRILTQPNFIPTEKQYRGLCENKYAQKVLKAHFADPKYPAGSKVSLRATAPRRLASLSGETHSLVEWGRSQRSANGFVLTVNAAPITTAAAGTKKYLVLFVGESIPLLVEERHLKRGRF